MIELEELRLAYAECSRQRFELLAKLKNLQPEPEPEPVAWRVHPFDYGVGIEGAYAMTMRPEQVEAWKRKGWNIESLYAAPPKRKPINTDMILATWVEECIPKRSTPELIVAFARAIERAHGIGGEE